MVLSIIPAAIHGRRGVFTGVHCRMDSLRVRISGHRPTAADVSPTTYNYPFIYISRFGYLRSSLPPKATVRMQAGYRELLDHLTAS